jgi:hypothetical protein
VRRRVDDGYGSGAPAWRHVDDEDRTGAPSTTASTRSTGRGAPAWRRVDEE